MIFPKVKFCKTLRVDESTRISSASIVTPDENGFQLVEVDPDGSGTYYDITGPLYLDWVYETAGIQTGAIRVTTNALNVQEKTFDVTVLTESEDIIFSTDDDIRCLEPEIDCYIKDGKCSFLYIHRCVCESIIKWIADQGVYKEYKCCIGSPCHCDNSLPDRYTKEDLNGNCDVKAWATFQALHIIFEGQSNSIDDFFAEKSRYYKSEFEKARHRSRIDLDTDGDGKADCRLEVSCVRIKL